MHNGNNSLKTVALLGLLSAILIVGGRWLAGEQGIYYGLAIAVVMNFASYFFSDKIALAMSGAQPLTRKQRRKSTLASRRWSEISRGGWVFRCRSSTSRQNLAERVRHRAKPESLFHRVHRGNSATDGQ